MTWCRANDVDAWYRHGGYLRVSASAAQDGEWRSAVEACAGLGVADQYVELTPAEIQARCASPAMRGGALMPNAATVQPARLARGLRRALAARGVTILEGTRVTRLRPGSPVQLETARGTLAAEQVVLALNAWAAGWRDFATTLLAWGSHIVLTEPIPGRLAELGWTGGEAIADARFTVHYFRTTPDGRLAFGAGVGAAGFGGRVDRRYDSDPRAEERARASLRRFFPTLADVRIDDAWGGPIDISPDRLPMIGSRHGGRVHFAHGFSGNGVAPAVFAGRVLAGLVDEPQRESSPGCRSWTAASAASRPEPVRYAGVRRGARGADSPRRGGGRRAPPIGPGAVLRQFAAPAGLSVRRGQAAVRTRPSGRSQMIDPWSAAGLPSRLQYCFRRGPQDRKRGGSTRA